MIYRCKNCQYEEARGCLPTAMCGLYFLALMGVCAFALVPVLHSQDAGRAVDGMGWWKLLIIPIVAIAGFVVLVIAAIILDLFLGLIEYLAFAARKCPTCGKRRWSWGFTRGFGL